MRIVIEIDGGVVSRVCCDQPGVEFVVIDGYGGDSGGDDRRLVEIAELSPDEVAITFANA